MCLYALSESNRFGYHDCYCEYVDHRQHINMLLIGETGVGKSTWINAFANYCKFSSLEEAVQAGGLFPIPFTLQLRHPVTKQMMCISSEGNVTAVASQTAEVGESVTRMPNEYIFEYRGRLFNMIDTPGLMDTRNIRGHDKDKEHVSDILRLLSAYDKIHAICILLKANVNRLSSNLTYTLTELLRHLDAGACNNVIFIFTYGACKADEIQSILQKFLTENKLNIPIPPNKQTMYVFDNQAVNYLVMCKNKIRPSEDDETDAPIQWQRAVRSKTAMLEYICSLTPHALAGINAMHNAEHTIDVLSRLVLETLMCISKDQDGLEQQKKMAQARKAEITRNPTGFARDELRKLLFVTESKVHHSKLDYTNVVCESARCGKVVNGIIVYPQICCKHCRSTLFMYFCGNINWLGDCKVCGCGKSKHEWRKTVTEIVTETVYKPDESVIEQIVDSSDTMIELNSMISEYQRRVEMGISEREEMLRTCARLNIFVHRNAMMAHDDKLSMRLQDKIQIHEKERSTAKELEVLRQIQRQYKMFLDNEKSADDVDELIQRLYKLPMKGNDLKRVMEVEERARHAVVEAGKTSRMFNLAPWRAQPRKLVYAVSGY